jgi:Tol biopolymer transport system component
MNHLHKAKAYILVILSISFLIFSCGSNIAGPQDIPKEECILFIRNYDNVSEICSINPDGTDLQIIKSSSGKEFLSAQWSPDKRLIAISGGQEVSLEYNTIRLIDNLGNLRKKVTHSGGSPCWSSDGNEILFSRPKDFKSFYIDYYIVNINTLTERLVLESDESIWANADWSSDGQYILTNEEYVYTNGEGDRVYSDREVVIIHLADGAKIQLTDTNIMDGEARWSPEESKIVYISGKYVTGNQIKLMSYDGSCKEILVDTLALYRSPRWSPDGERIAYSKQEKLDGFANYGPVSDIFVLDLANSEIKQITNFANESTIVHVQDWR